ncbi:alpha/beta hydrolase [Streptomyces sp. NPDC059740]|uniref:alpha/beta hydrolase n=1 Tax=Streptomyces sp. NPDC059740 TaxID=3346926 RepID=UPI00365491BB
MRARALYGTVAGSLVLTALVTAPATGADASPEQATGSAPAAPAAVHPLTFGRCPAAEHLPSTVQCGTLTVPLDYAHPEGRKIQLTVSRARATGKRSEHQGALVYNPGGPGASSMDFPLYGQLEAWRRTARAYDFVGYAPRGVGRSAPLSCQDPKVFAQAPTDSPVHPSEDFKQRKLAQAKAYARGCARSAGPALPYYNSVNNARDLDMLRAALGQDRLNYLGASYGTYFGALYATLYPSHVRRMVFDSVVDPDPDQIWYQNNLAQNVSFEGRWHDFRRWVARHDGTYHLGRDEAAVGRAYEKVRDRLRRHPAGGKVGPGQLQAAFLKAGYNDAYWPPRAAALSAFLKGDEKPLLAQAAPMPETAKEDENGNAVYTAVECNDAPWPRDWHTWDADNTRVAASAPFETWDNAWLNLPCAFWPKGHKARVSDLQRPLDVGTLPGALPPVLLLAAERDGATPYAGALELQRRLSGSSLVTERGSGTHGIAFGDNTCVNRHVEDYLLKGVTAGRSSFCGPHKEPSPTQRAKADRAAKHVK